MNSPSEGAGAELNCDLELTPTPQRRDSNISLNSNNAKLTFPSFTTTTYDSGNYSSSCSYVSDAGGAAEHPTPSSATRPKENEQALFLALQDVRKLRSELERLHKSEQWYKQELRQHKSTRFEVVDRLYAQERKYVQENQRLQRECVRLYAKCSEMELELAEQNEKTAQKLSRDVFDGRANEEGCVESSLEMEQQKALIKDQQEIISVLRKQKRALLEDLERLGVEKDERVSELQRTLTGMEVEHKRATVKCKKLQEERRELEQTLEGHTTYWEMDTGEREQLKVTISELREQLATKKDLLASKELEISEFKEIFKRNLEQTVDADEIHLLSLSHYAEMSAKTAEIAGLKTALLVLQEELVEHNKRESLIEENERLISDLRSKLEESQFELENRQRKDATQAQHIIELELNIEKFQKERDCALQQLQATQTTLKNVEKELIALSTNYASMCAICESTKLKLELQEIEHGKRIFERKTDAREIDQLRERLKEYLERTAEMSRKIDALETQLQESREKKEKIKNTLEDVTQKLKEEKERCSSLETENREKDNELQQNRDVADLKTQYWQTELTEQLQKYKDKIKELRRNVKTNEDTVERLREENNRLQVDSDDEDKEIQKSLTEEQFNDYLSVQKLERELKEQKDFSSELSKENQRLKFHIEEREELRAFEKNSPAKESLKTSASDADLEQLNAKNQELLRNLNRQRELFAEKEQLLERFNHVIVAESKMQEQLIKEKLFDKADEETFRTTTKAKLEVSAALMESLIQQNQILYKKFSFTDHHKLEVELREKTRRCESLQRELSRIFRANNVDRPNLDLSTERACCDDICRRYRQVRDDYEDVVRNNQRIQQELYSARKVIEELRKELKNEIENKAARVEEQEKTIANKEEFSELPGHQIKHSALESLKPQVCHTFFSKESDEQELLALRAKVRELEEQLQLFSTIEEEKRAGRVELIKKLLKQQNDKVQQLQAAQVDWEELLKALNDTQRLEEQTRKELIAKSAELEELNVLFEEHNEELRELHERNFLDREKLSEEITNIRETFHQQKKILQEQLKAKSDESAEQQRLIEDFKLKNERYERDLCDLREVYASETAMQKRQLQILQANLERQQEEREKEEEDRNSLEKELSELRRSKRSAVIMPELVFCSQSSSSHSETESDEIASVSLKPESFECSSDNQRLRILTKVLEAEYARKMQRYDLHIRTLLGNIKSLKKALKVAEQKAVLLRSEQARTAEELQELQMAKRNAEELRFKCSQSQSTIKALEQALDEERQRFAATDAGKEAQAEEAGAHEVSNLIDDYKKLIQQSAAATQRPNTRAILDLIQRSSQCEPNLQQLESNISDLSSDLRAFIAAYAQTAGSSTLTQAVLKAQPSLLDELRVASENI